MFKIRRIIYSKNENVLALFNILGPIILNEMCIRDRRMLIGGVKTYNFPETLCLMRADEGLYNRRGGWNYLKKVVVFRTKMRKMHFCSFLQYLVGICGQGIVCLAPSRLCRWIYVHFLRRPSKKLDVK